MFATVRRPLQRLCQQRLFSSKNKVKFLIVGRQGEENHVEATVGQSLLEVSQAHNLDVEGACDGTAACSTCHIYVNPETFEQLPEVEDDELDMLELAIGYDEDASRLACQVFVTEEFNGHTFTLPESVRNAME
ncbi:MAG: hypothetical protein MHM6MM_000662 [Cercozoa sp. M6MM]